MKYKFKSVTGDEAIIIASNEKDARKEAMIEIWDRKRKVICSIPSDEGKGLDLVSVVE